MLFVVNTLCARSSGDRAPVSGTGCAGSIPAGRTIRNIAFQRFCWKAFLLFWGTKYDTEGRFCCIIHKDTEEGSAVLLYPLKSRYKMVV